MTTKGEETPAGLKDLGIVPGIVASRRCPTCGHHEVGYETADGTFVPLRPGDRIGVFPQSPTLPHTEGLPRHPETQSPSGDADVSRWVPWVPEPLRPSRSLCRKYGVLINTALVGTPMTPGLYETAYRRKLERLIEKEGVMPLSVLLNSRFAAAHLASGNPKQAADAMWEELDEIREPVTRVKQWLADPGDASLLKMIHPWTTNQLEGPMPTDDQLKEELSALSLEDFLDAL